MKNIAITAIKHRDILSKQNAFTAFETIVNQLSDTQKINFERELAILYLKFFKADPVNRINDPFLIIGKFAAHRDIREYLEYVYVTEDSVTASNGHYLATMPNLENLDTGFYSTKQKIKLEEFDFYKYPKFDKILQGKGKWNDVDINDIIDLKQLMTDDKKPKPYICVQIGDYYYNESYIQKVKKFYQNGSVEQNESGILKVYDEKTRIIFVVMPIKL